MYKIIAYSFLLLGPFVLNAQVFRWEDPKVSPPTPPAAAEVEVEKSGTALYTIQLGTFYEPTLADFKAIEDLGPLYCVKGKNNIYQVFMGTYASGSQLENTLQQVKAKGYTAYSQSLSGVENKKVAVIQLVSTQNGKSLSWEHLEQVGKLYGLLEQAQVFKVVTGPYASKEIAAAQLPTLRANGFKDAFVKMVDAQLLSPISYFEKGLSPIAFTKDLADEIDRIAQARTPENYTPQQDIPVSTVPPASIPNTNIPASPPIEKNYLPVPKTALPVPSINAKVKRTSALDLQKILKSEKHYAGSLDGYYGKGTGLAYQKFKQQDYRYKKQQLIATHLSTSEEAPTSGLQYLINSLTNNDASLIAALQRSSHPIAKAYLGYWKFVNQGPSAEVNHLLNTAIKESFQGQQVSTAPPFDVTATYDYTSLKQVLLHLRYLHAAPSNGNYAVPCWVFERHPQAANEVYTSNKLATLATLKVSGCLRFDDWESIKALQYFIAELQPKQLSPEQQAEWDTHTTGRAFLYLFPTALTKAQKKEVDQWKIQFWKALAMANNQYPLLEKYYPTLKTVFFQSQVLMEDYYMQQGFTADEAEGLALSVLRTYIAVPLEVYLK